MEIYKYRDYRKFLRTLVAAQPRNGWGLVSRMAEFLRVDQVVMSQILTGKRELTFDQAHQLAKFWNLTEIELDYFILMVMAERAATSELRKYALQKMTHQRSEMLKVSHQIPPDQTLTDSQRSIFYSSWIYSAVRLFCDIDGGKTIDKVATHFQISRTRSHAVLRFLKEAGLCHEVGGVYSMGAQRTTLEFGSPFLVRHHTNWRVRAIEHTERIRADEMMITSPVSLSREDFEIIRSELLELLKKISARVRDSKSEEVACLNIDWFRVEN